MSLSQTPVKTALIPPNTSTPADVMHEVKAEVKQAEKGLNSLKIQGSSAWAIGQLNGPLTSLVIKGLKHGMLLERGDVEKFTLHLFKKHTTVSDAIGEVNRMRNYCPAIGDNPSLEEVQKRTNDPVAMLLKGMVFRAKSLSVNLDSSMLINLANPKPDGSIDALGVQTLKDWINGAYTTVKKLRNESKKPLEIYTQALILGKPVVASKEAFNEIQINGLRAQPPDKEVLTIMPYYMQLVYTMVNEKETLFKDARAVTPCKDPAFKIPEPVAIPKENARVDLDLF
jgi:hypothetical protein